MAIALDTSANLGSTSGTSLTVAYTCTGSNLVLFVLVEGDVAPSDKITGVTYNSVAMTLIDKKNAASGIRVEYLFGLLGPATGAHNIVISASSVITIAGAAASYTGVSQVGLPDAFTDNSATSTTSIATAITTKTDKCWVLYCGANSGGGGSGNTGGANTTLRQSAAGNGDAFIGDTNGTVHPAGAITMNVSDSGANNWLVIAASFAPVDVTPYARHHVSVFIPITLTPQLVLSPNLGVLANISGTRCASIVRINVPKASITNISVCAPGTSSIT